MEVRAPRPTTCFNSRTPGGVRPRLKVYQTCDNHVSIHAPREGCDGANNILTNEVLSFNSRTPGGVRLLSAI